MISNKELKVCIVGLGYVGLTLSVFIANKGVHVHGLEISEQILDCLKKECAHFFEENFDLQLKRVINNGFFSFGREYPKNDSQTLYIITVGTPLNSEGKTNLIPLETVLETLSTQLKDNDIVMLRSTVKVGTTRDIAKPILDKSNKRYHLCFCPERTLEGKAFEELQNLPQIVSGIDDGSITTIKSFFEYLGIEPFALKSLEEAEMVKLVNNTERDLMFAFANEIALMCDAKNLNVSDIITAANYKYSRSNLKKPGIVGGPCLEKDPYILEESFSDSTYRPSLFRTGRKINESLVEYSLNNFFANFLKQNHKIEKVAILGFAFKGTPPTSDMRGSLVNKVIDCVKNKFRNTKIYGHDYLVSSEEMQELGVFVESDLKKTIENADIIIFQNNHPNYKKEDWEHLQKISPNAVIYDFWNQFNNTNLNNLYKFKSLGVN